MIRKGVFMCRAKCIFTMDRGGKLLQPTSATTALSAPTVLTRRCARVTTALMVAAAGTLFTLTGCMVPSTTTQTEYRQYKLSLVETVMIMTEPPGARVYVVGEQTNFVGISPVEATLTAPEVPVIESGTYGANGLYNLATSEYFGKLNRTGLTKWSSRPSLGGYPGAWTIKAYLNDQQIAEREIRVMECNAYRQAASLLQIEDGKLSPPVVEGRSSILLAFERPTISSPREKRPPDRQGDPNAEAEYHAALDTYNAALQKLKEAQMHASMPPVFSGETGGWGAVGALTQIARQQNLAQAQNEVEVARQRLEAARIKAYGR